jgi:hypothetical protein
MACRAAGCPSSLERIGQASPHLSERRAFAAESGIRNVEFHQAEMEALPLPDDSVDVVISMVCRMFPPGGQGASREPGARCQVALIGIDRDDRGCAAWSRRVL